MTGSALQARMLLVAGVFAGLFLLMLGRAVDLTVLQGSTLAELAARQHRQRIELLPHRGPVVDRNGEALALSVDVPSIYVRPRDFAAQAAHLPALAAALGLTVREVRDRLAGDQPFVWLKRQASPREAEAIERLGLRGVAWVAESRRFYPQHTLAAHVLGFVGIDSQGLEGLEHQFDRFLRGEPRYLEVDRDAHGREMYTRGLRTPPAQGGRLELTLDARVQDVTERELAAGVAASRAVAGAAVVLDARTGEVLALANVPTYDPNEPRAGRGAAWRSRIRNRAITDAYEPGSTFKAMLAAAAVAERVVSPDEMLYCEEGRYQLGGWPIRDAHPHGWLTFAEVIQFSSNIGAAKVAERLGQERFYEYLRTFGFGARTGIALPGETAGIMRPVEAWARIDLATHSFGQGISVTPLQMAVAFAAIANGGELVRPFVVRRIVAADGRVVLRNRPAVVRRVISPQAARTVTALLERVVHEPGGTGTRARLDGFTVAGKTGTAQKAKRDGRGYSAKRVGSFAGFAPADDPRIAVLVLIDEPRTSSYGGVVAAPVFRAIATAALERFGVESIRPAGAQPVAAAPQPASPRGAPASGGTPSFLGLSLREVFARAQETGWDVRVTGTGYVRAQVPAVGAPPADDPRLALRLEPGE
jgi:cell division protein FtsI (penicillin-binding protein 3)